MVRKIRLTLAIIFFVCITLMFLDFTGVTHTWFSWMAKLQFLPAVFALNVGVIILLIALTLIFGRIYCSVICPMGVFQDIIAWFGKKARPKKERKIPYHRWCGIIRCLAGSIQLLWQNCQQHFPAYLSLGQQHPGFHRREI